MSDKIGHRMDLVGAKFIVDMPYYDELPPGFIKCPDFKYFFKLKKHKRVIRKENLEKKIGMEFIVYSPATNRYWYRQTWEFTNMRKLYKYFQDGNLYILREERLPEDDESILF